MDEQLTHLTRYALVQQASDIHLTSHASNQSDSVPCISIRVDGELYPVPEHTFSPTQLASLFKEILTETQTDILNQRGEIDFLYTVENTRLRACMYKQHNGLALSLRIINEKITTLSELGMSNICTALEPMQQGLILVTGPTGSGKSTTLSAILDFYNQHKKHHILTIEDPIEYIHTNKNSIVHQREIHHHTESFTSALKSALRSDPDIIMLGELRDLQSITLALTAAETGHLIISTLHTQSAIATISRIIDVFPANQQNQIRSQLAGSLQMVLSQRLQKKVGGGRIATYELLLNSPAVANLVRENQLHQLLSTMQTGNNTGMHTLQQHINLLQQQGLLNLERL